MPGLDKFFGELWLKSEFSVPIAKVDRVTLRLQLETASRMGEVFRPENQKVRKTILDRLGQIEEFEKMIAQTA